MTIARSLVGSHVAVAGGLIKTGLREASEVGAEAIQVFVGNPRSWKPTPIDHREDERFRQACDDAALQVFVHAPYLINFGSPSAATREQSAVALLHTMNRAASIGARAVVVHAGSCVTSDRRARALGRLHDLISPLLDTAPAGVRLLIEPTAGGGEALASTITTTLDYMSAVADERTGVCLDTCHLQAAGAEAADADALRRSLEQLTDSIGPDRLGLIHVNDSRDPPGSRRDRHESLGEGTIGLPALAALFTTPAVRGVPLIVETPTHQSDVSHLKQLRTQPTAQASSRRRVSSSRGS